MIIRFLGRFYYWLLWIAGAALTNEELLEIMDCGDRLTFWMRRSKKRLGNWWWVAVFFTVLLHTIILYDNFKKKHWVKVFIGFAGWGLLIYLLPHVFSWW